MINYLFLNSAGVWGGNEKWTHMAATALAKYNNVYLTYKNRIVGERFMIDTMQLPFRFNFDPQTIFPLISFVKKNNIDILIPTKKRDYVISGIVARKCKKKNVLRLGIVRKLGRNPYKNLVYNTLSDGIIVNAEKIKEVLLASPYLSEDKVRVIYNGLDTESIDARLAEEFIKNKPFPFMICTVGRISKRKGLDVAIKMFAGFLKRTSAKDAGLVITGSGKTDR
jgi:glycosyltransferase involved in cell wall biosynthesis